MGGVTALAAGSRLTSRGGQAAILLSAGNDGIVNVWSAERGMLLQSISTVSHTRGTFNWHAGDVCIMTQMQSLHLQYFKALRLTRHIGSYNCSGYVKSNVGYECFHLRNRTCIISEVSILRI